MRVEDIDPSEFVTDRMAMELADEHDKLRYVATESAVNVFKSLSESDEKFVMLSGYSDYCVVNQEEFHPNEDLYKLSWRMNWPEVSRDRKSYAAVKLGPACNMEQCDNDHLFSVKIDSFTTATFNRMPEAVGQWFVPNLNVVDERMSLFPFGISSHHHGLGLLPAYRGREKKKLLYVNFQVNTMQRMRLQNHFRNLGWVTFREGDLPIDKYYEEISEHAFVLCPFGNGFDCYRTYESMYLGCIPILEDCQFSAYLCELGLPLMTVDNFGGLNPNSLGEVWQSFQQSKDDFNLKPLTKSYWREQVLEAAESL